MLTRTRRPQTASPKTPSASGATDLPPFRNEPPTDYARAENREAMRQALEEVRPQLGRGYPLLIGGNVVDTGTRVLDSVDPSQSSRVVGEMALAGVEHALAAVKAARAAFGQWATTPVADRADVLGRRMSCARVRTAFWMRSEEYR